MGLLCFSLPPHLMGSENRTPSVHHMPKFSRMSQVFNRRSTVSSCAWPPAFWCRRSNGSRWKQSRTGSGWILSMLQSSLHEWWDETAFWLASCVLKISEEGQQKPSNDAGVLSHQLNHLHLMNPTVSSSATQPPGRQEPAPGAVRGPGGERRSGAAAADPWGRGARRRAEGARPGPEAPLGDRTDIVDSWAGKTRVSRKFWWQPTTL